MNVISSNLLEEAYQQITEDVFASEVTLSNDMWKEHHQSWRGVIFWPGYKVYAAITVDFNWDEITVEPHHADFSNEGGMTSTPGHVFITKMFPTYHNYVKKNDMKAAQVELEAYMESHAITKKIFQEFIGMGYKFIKDKSHAFAILDDAP